MGAWNENPVDEVGAPRPNTEGVVGRVKVEGVCGRENAEGAAVAEKGCLGVNTENWLVGACRKVWGCP